MPGTRPSKPHVAEDGFSGPRMPMTWSLRAGLKGWVGLGDGGGESEGGLGNSVCISRANPLSERHVEAEKRRCRHKPTRGVEFTGESGKKRARLIRGTGSPGVD